MLEIFDTLASNGQWRIVYPTLEPVPCHKLFMDSNGLCLETVDGYVLLPWSSVQTLVIEYDRYDVTVYVKSGA